MNEVVLFLSVVYDVCLLSHYKDTNQLPMQYITV